VSGDKRLEMKNILFKQDGAAFAHTENNGNNFLRGKFWDCEISRHGDIAWPVHSPDLSVCDLLLWGYLKSKVYEKNRTLEELKEAIRQMIGTKTNQILSKVFIRRSVKCLTVSLQDLRSGFYEMATK
jgi:hypothetical protein